jgi:hypothetical protein
VNRFWLGLVELWMAKALLALLMPWNATQSMFDGVDWAPVLPEPLQPPSDTCVGMGRKRT